MGLSLQSAASAPEAVLGSFWLGVEASPAVPWPCQAVGAPLLGAAVPALAEVWHSDSPLQAGCSQGIVWRRQEDLLFGCLALNEADFAGGDGGPALQQAGEAAYRRIFALLAEAGVPHLWRVWNYLDHINAEGQGLERYRQFNIGRQQAFQTCVGSDTVNVPAACALGLQGPGRLNIAFLAGVRPPLPVENPRQVSAYHYPTVYGPASPTFSRAVLAYPRGQEALFISGTASIVGHQTLHGGDVLAQCRETMTNIETVVAEANRVARSGPFALGELSYRVYVRHGRDYPLVVQGLSPWLQGADVNYVQADVCRHDLLLEVEAQGFHGLAALEE